MATYKGARYTEAEKVANAAWLEAYWERKRGPRAARELVAEQRRTAKRALRRERRRIKEEAKELAKCAPSWWAAGSRKRWAATAAIFNRYRKSASSRNLSFGLGRADVDRLARTRCTYCDASGRPFGGLDRVENAVGYERGNVVACCGTCNQMKGYWSVAWLYQSCSRIQARADQIRDYVMNLPERKLIEFRLELRLPPRTVDALCSKWKVFRNSQARVAFNRYEYVGLVLRPCVYCGRFGEFGVVGLDRVNNATKSYTRDNVVPCCWSCNRMKLDRTVGEFIERASAIHEFMSSPGYPLFAIGVVDPSVDGKFFRNIRGPRLRLPKRTRPFDPWA